MHKLVSWSAAVLLAVATAASGFSNLDFELYSGLGPDLLPDWERNSGDYLWPLLDMLPISTSGLGLVSPEGDYLFPIAGQYSAFFSAGTGDSPLIWQTDVVPIQATHIQIATTGIDPANDAFTYALGGISLIESTPVSMGGYSVYTTDIHALAGHPMERRVTRPARLQASDRLAPVPRTESGASKCAPDCIQPVEAHANSHPAWPTEGFRP